jgi:hypothetical protein
VACGQGMMVAMRATMHGLAGRESTCAVLQTSASRLRSTLQLCLTSTLQLGQASAQRRRPWQPSRMVPFCTVTRLAVCGV